MSEADLLHEQAMEFYDLAHFAKKNGQDQNVLENYKKAFVLEKKAALAVTNAEQSLKKAIFLRGAISIAMLTNEYKEAEYLCCYALMQENLTEKWQQEFRKMLRNIWKKMKTIKNP